jgi:hypothetical protein
MAEETHGHRQKCKWIIWKERKKTSFHNSITKRGQQEILERRRQRWRNQNNIGIDRNTQKRDFRLSPRYKWSLRSSGMSSSVAWKSITDVSRQPIGPTFKQDGTDKQSAHTHTHTHTHMHTHTQYAQDGSLTHYSYSTRDPSYTPLLCKTSHAPATSAAPCRGDKGPT